MVVQLVVVSAEIEPAEGRDNYEEAKQAKDNKEGDVGANEPREHKAHENAQNSDTTQKMQVSSQLRPLFTNVLPVKVDK